MKQSAPDRLQELLLAARSGDQRAFEVLLEQYTPLVDSMAASHAERAGDSALREDFRQEACIAFYHAVAHYEPSAVTFGTYAKECIRNRLISCLRSLRKQSTVVSLEEDGEKADESDPASRIVEEENYQALYRRIESALSPYENRVWWLYLSGRSAKEIAQRLGETERSVQNAVYRIRKKLRETIPNP